MGNNKASKVNLGDVFAGMVAASEDAVTTANVTPSEPVGGVETMVRLEPRPTVSSKKQGAKRPAKQPIKKRPKRRNKAV